MPRDQASLALDGRLSVEAGTRQGGRQTPCGLVLVEVTGFELDEVNFARLADAFEVPGFEHSPLAQVGAEVVDQHATFNISTLGGSALQPNSLH